MSLIPGKLDSDEIKAKLDEARVMPTDEVWKKMMEMFWRMDSYNSFISIPKVADILVKFLKSKKGIPSTRTEFYDFYFEKISLPDKLKKKTEMVAVVMELLQANEISETEFVELLKQIKISKKEKEQLRSHGLIENRTKKDDSTPLVGFTHHTVQEYLAALNILKNENQIKYLEKLALINQEGVVAIKPSWYGAIRFLVENDPAKIFIKWLVDLGEKYNEVVDDGFSIVVTESVPNDVGLKKRIFDLIYKTYQERTVWLPRETRFGLAPFCDKEHLIKFRGEIDKGDNNTETIVRSGNIASIIENLLEIDSPLTSEEEKKFWKNKFIDWVMAEDDNGVLTRTSLGALEYFNDETLIEKFTPIIKKKDSMVKNAFVRFCTKIAPNSENTIDVLINQIKHVDSIYGRHGLYEINSTDGIKILLRKMSEDTDFVKRFLNKESIFNDRGKEQDKVIIELVRKNVDNGTVGLLKKIIKNALQEYDYFDPERSYFLKQLALIVANFDKNYIYEALNDVRACKDGGKWQHILFNYQELFVWIVRNDDEQLKRFFVEIKEIDGGLTRIFDGSIYRAGGEVFKKAIKLKLVEKLKPSSREISTKGNIKNDGINPTYVQFQKYLEPSPGKFVPAVFEYYSDNKKIIDELMSVKEKTRLIKLIVDEGLAKIDPRQIKVTMPNRSERKYNISSVAQYFGAVVRAARDIGVDLGVYKQRLIDFIPFAYSDDRATIVEIVDTISDKEIEWMNSIYADTKNDIRFLLPDSYVYFVKIYSEKGCRLESAGQILKSFVGDELVAEYDRIYALETYEKFVKIDGETKKFLQSIFTVNIGSEKDLDVKLAKVANGILITNFEDEESINWRFEQIRKLKGKAESYIPPTSGIVHEVGEFENELHELAFAKPLTKLKDEKYVDKFLELLDFSFELLKENKTQYWSFVNYLWRVVINFVDKQKYLKSFKLILEFISYSDKYKKIDGSSWFLQMLDKERDLYEQYIGIDGNLERAILLVEQNNVNL